jgi:hypothetical protein
MSQQPLVTGRRLVHLATASLLILFGGAILVGQDGPEATDPPPVAEAIVSETPPASDEGSADSRRESLSPPEAAAGSVARPLIILLIGVAIVLGLIIVLKVNAFLALISAAIFVSLCAPGDMGDKIERVARAFGSTAGGIALSSRWLQSSASACWTAGQPIGSFAFSSA